MYVACKAKLEYPQYQRKASIRSSKECFSSCWECADGHGVIVHGKGLMTDESSMERRVETIPNCHSDFQRKKDSFHNPHSKPIPFIFISIRDPECDENLDA